MKPLAEGLLVYLDQHQRVQLLTQLAAASNGGHLGATLSTETGPMRHPLWHPATTKDPEVWMSSGGWRARGQTMAEASAAFGRPLTTPADAATAWRLVSAVSATGTGPQKVIVVKQHDNVGKHHNQGDRQAQGRWSGVPCTREL